MSVGIKVEYGTSLRVARKKLKSLGEAAMLPELYESIGSLVENQTKRRIAEEKRAPDGTDWPDWSDRYAESKHGFKRHKSHPGQTRQAGGHSILQLYGDLLQSITYEVNKTEVAVGSPLVYAAVHQFGHDKIPARAYLGLSEENRDEIEELISDFLDDALRRA